MAGSVQRRRSIQCLGVTGQTALPADASGLTYAVIESGGPILVLK
jgi:hypothetical protein